MKNYEKYKDEIKNCKDETFCNDFVKPRILGRDSCAGVGCIKCCMIQMMWLLEEYKEPQEPETDWSKVKVDTPILVKAIDDNKWKKRYFAQYKNGIVYAWDGGKTSWNKDCMTSWKHAKLVEDQKEPEIDWSKIKVDTPILVKDSEDSKWLERYFAKYEDGLVYAWLGENTSYDTCNAAKWKYAKLAESEEENI